MRYVEGVPRSEQILWFIDNYEKKEYKSADRQHVMTHKDTIDNVDRREEKGVKYSSIFYEYLYPEEELDERYTEVFYPVDNITLGELI
jgi:hypothetical protein